MKPLLIASQILCIASLVLSGSLRRYRFLGALLVCACVATAAFRADEGWLRQWYGFLAAPVAGLRFFAALEVSYRQTERFPRWARLTGGCILLAYFYTASVWNVTAPGGLELFVYLRRYLQVWCGAFFLALETFWICFDQWRYRREDWTAGIFGGMLLNHAGVSLAGIASAWPGLTWWRVSWVSWAVDSLCWLLLAVMFLGARSSAQDLQQPPTIRGVLSGAFDFPRSDHQSS